MIIYKYPLIVADRQTVSLPKDAEILSVQIQCDALRLWAIVDPDAEDEDRIIEINGTGFEMKDLSKEGLSRLHINTVQVYNGAVVWHVFELI